MGGIDGYIDPITESYCRDQARDQIKDSHKILNKENDPLRKLNSFDDMILPAVKLFIDKGYSVERACSGHVGDIARISYKNCSSDTLGENNTYIEISANHIDIYAAVDLAAEKKFTVDPNAIIVGSDDKVNFIIERPVSYIGGDSYLGSLVSIYDNCLKLYEIAQAFPDIKEEADETK